MTRYQHGEPITVGIDGSPDGLRAVEYAAIEAREQHRPIRLVHACYVGTLLAPMAPMYGVDVLRQEGVAALDAAERRVRTFGIAITVDKSQIAASVSAALVEASKTSALVVIGRRSVSRVERVLTGSTSSAVATKAHCPVVSVPVSWKPGESDKRIVVGVDGSETGRHAVEFAFAEASRRRVSLMAVRSWEFPSRWYADIPNVSSEDEAWLERMEIGLSEDLAGYREENPDVQVARVFERSSSAAEALCRRSDGASLLVIGRRGLGAGAGLELGWTARSVLAHATCPVAVVHKRDHQPSDNLIPAMHGALSS